MRVFIACFKLFSFVLMSLVIVPAQSLVLLFHKGRGAYLLPWLWHICACRIFNIRLTIEGVPSSQAQTLYMSNHLSYLDIPVLGSILKASFIAKKDVEGWPVFGYLAKLQQTYFIDRSRSAIGNVKNELERRIQTGESLIVFPEGTSTSGLSVLPFKSSLFSLAYGQGRENLHVQPISITLQAIDGRAPTNKDEQDLYAWPRDMDTELHDHLWRFAKTSGADLHIIFHPPLKASTFSNRKLLAQSCYDHVNRAFESKSETFDTLDHTQNAA